MKDYPNPVEKPAPRKPTTMCLLVKKVNFRRNAGVFFVPGIIKIVIRH